jgi:hypothetical protein
MRVAGILAVALWALLAAHAHAADAAPAPTYDQMLATLKGGDTNIDFKAFRYAFAETPQYSPYAEHGDKRAMFRALQAGDYQTATMLANEILAADYTDLDAHFVCFVAYDKSHDGTDAQFHRTVVRGLMDSISESGDGKSADTAYVVIAVREEYAYLGLSGYDVNGQTLVKSNSGPVDAMDVTDQMTREHRTIYFNVSRSFAALEHQFGGAKDSAP